MAEQTGIQWTDSTWNVVTGCTRVSPGCARCYIERTPPFRMIGRRFATVGGEATTGVTLHWDRLEKVPRGPKVFTPSLGDLFHEDVPDTFIAAVFDAMRLHPDRIFQVLTKRPERAHAWCLRFASAFQRFVDGASWPLPNVWLGVSIENARYTWRADVLREIPAAVRFISAEPLLGSLFHGSVRTHPDPLAHAAKPLDLTAIDWVIIGGESGPRARPCHLELVREIIGACRAHGAPAVFVKQLGAKPIDGASHSVDDPRAGSWAWTLPLELRDRKGGDIEEWPADLRIREFPRSAVPA